MQYVSGKSYMKCPYSKNVFQMSLGYTFESTNEYGVLKDTTDTYAELYLRRWNRCTLGTGEIKSLVF
jgi:hypothetical protein